MPDEITWNDWGHEVHHHQRVLFARNVDGHFPILASQGDLVTREIANHSTYLDDHCVDGDLSQLQPGLYVWEGVTYLSGGGGEYPDEVDFNWEGRIRRATAADLASFGLALEVSA